MAKDADANGRAEDLARDPDAFLPPRFDETLGGDQDSGGDGRIRRDPGTGIFYLSDELLTTEPFVDAVASVLRSEGIRFEGPIDTFPGDEYQQEPPTRARDADDGGGLDIVRTFQLVSGPDREHDALEVARVIAKRAADPESDIDPRVKVGPHHVLTIAPTPSIGPGTDPLPADPGDAIACGEAISGPRVGVVDTGLWKEARQWSFIEDGSELENPLPQAGQPVPMRGSGHGGFIAWIINCVAPGTMVAVKNGYAGRVLTETTVVGKVMELIADGHRVINLSLGTKPDTCFGTIPVALEQAIGTWRSVRDLVIVAAAGNDASTTPWYPAGYAADPRYEDVVASVGALEEITPRKRNRVPDARVARFSNRGDWVTAWAPGADLVSAYPKDVQFVYQDPNGGSVTESFPDGAAEWSGTSFATPIAAAQIARAAQERRTTPRKAWRGIRSGRPFAVFWPDWWSDDDPCAPDA